MYKPEDYHQLVQYCINCKVIFALGLITSHFKDVDRAWSNMVLGGGGAVVFCFGFFGVFVCFCIVLFFAKYTYLCFSTQKLARYKTYLKSFLSTMQQLSLRGGSFRWCLNNEFFFQQ